MINLRVEDMVLVCGFARSGTTWLQKILDTDPKVYSLHEPDTSKNKHFIFESLSHCIEPNDKKYIDLYRDAMDEVLQRIYSSLNFPPYLQKEYIKGSHQFYIAISSILRLINILVRRSNFRPVELPKILTRKNCSVKLVWKSVGQSSNLDFLRMAFPEIKIIYILRNPYAVLASMFKKDKMKLDNLENMRILSRKDSQFFLSNKINLEEIMLWEEIKKRALYWRIECENAVMSKARSKNFYIVTYEKLVEKPFDETRNIFNWLGWDMTKETRNFLSESTGAEKPKWYNLLISSDYFGVYRKTGINISDWKSRISDKDYAKISSVVNSSSLMSYWTEDIIKKGETLLHE